jgi:hypothetical protein
MVIGCWVSRLAPIVRLSGRQSPDDREVPSVTRRRREAHVDDPRRGRQRDPQIRSDRAAGCEAQEGRRRDADDLERLAPDPQGASDDGRVGVEAQAPEMIAEERDRLRALVVARLEHPSEHRSDADRGEVRTAHRFDIRDLRHGGGRDGLGDRRKRRDLGEAALAPLQVVEVGRRDRGSPVLSAVRRPGGEQRDVGGFSHADRLPHQLVQDRVDRRRHGHAECEREDGEQEEEGRGEQPPRAQSQIAAEAEERPEGREAAGVAALLLVGFEGAKLETRLAHRLGGGEPVALEVARAPVQVLAELVPHVALEAGAGA